MSWYLRSMGDRDTHRGTYSITAGIVAADCGLGFVPLTQTNSAPIVLNGDPPDPDQVCPECQQARPVHSAGQRSERPGTSRAASASTPWRNGKDDSPACTR